MVQNWFNDRPSYNGPAWSIASEWFAYLWCPVVVARLRSWRACLTMAFLSYAAMLAIFATLALPNGNLEHMFYVRIMGEFLGGVGLCLAWKRGGLVLGRIAVPLAAATLLVIWLYPASHSGDYWLAPALGVFVAALATATGPLVRWLSRPLMLRAGEASYCLYLTHYLLRDVVAGLCDWGRHSWFTAIPATVAIVLALGGAAYALHRLVEVPARRLLHARAS